VVILPVEWFFIEPSEPQTASMMHTLRSDSLITAQEGAYGGLPARSHTAHVERSQGLPADAFTTEKKLALIHATPRYLVKSKYLEDQNAIKPIIAIVPTGWSTAVAHGQHGTPPKSPRAAGVPQVHPPLSALIFACAAPHRVEVTRDRSTP
jgi:hypothetical protein